MPTIYYTNPGKNGSTNISSNVFAQIAQDCIETLVKKDYANEISLALPRNKKNVNVEIIKNKVSIQVVVNAYKDGNPNKVLPEIQQQIYNAIYEATEISNVKVDLAVMSFVDKK